MHQRHLRGGTTELIPRASLVGPTGVSKCVSYGHISCAERPSFSRVFVSREAANAGRGNFISLVSGVCGREICY